MGRLLDFFTAVTGRVQALLVAALAIAAMCLALAGWALLERTWRYQALADLERARGELSLARAQGKVLAKAVDACNAGVELARQAGEDGRKAGRDLLAAVNRLNAGNVATVAALEDLLAHPEKPGATCEDAWREIEQLRAKAAP